MSEYQQQLQNLIEKEEELKSLVEKLQRHFQHAEAALGEFSCATARITMKKATEEANDPEVEGPPVEIAYSLAYRKEKGGYQLVVIEDIDGEEQCALPVSSAPLRQRIEAAQLLPQLVRNLTVRTESLVEEIKKIVQ